MNTHESAAPIPTRVVVLTPSGRGAVATVLVQGPEAVEMVGRRFRPLSRRALEHYEIGSIVVGHFLSASDTSEELVVGLVAADRVEVHCHGGRAAVQAVVDSVTSQGAVPRAWEEFALTESDDPIAAEALTALAWATTERTAGVLLDQYRGALRQAIQAAIESIEAGWVDEAAANLSALLTRAGAGLHLTNPWRIAIVGRPNVGKSSLINALLGYERAIVFDQPGTTRDVLTARTAFDGWPVELLDMAGLREGADALEQAGIERARSVSARADLVLAVFDASKEWTADDAALLSDLGTGRTVIVHNKCDLERLARGDRPAGIAVSARTGENLEQLISTVVTRLVPAPIEPGSAVPFTPRQISAIATAKGALSAGEPRPAAGMLQAVLTIPSARRLLP